MAGMKVRTASRTSAQDFTLERREGENSPSKKEKFLPGREGKQSLPRSVAGELSVVLTTRDLD